MPKKGCLIVFEGIEGSGKTTASRNLQKYLTTKEHKALWTREPTSSKIGSLIEDILRGEITVAEEAIPLLFAADRADHTKRVIVPAIKKGYIVISDRYVHSSLAYQKSGMEKVFGKKENLPSQFCFITGPSMTADIRGIPFKGMHGPRKVIVILVG